MAPIQELIFSHMRQIKPFKLFRHDLNIYVFEYEQSICSTECISSFELTRRTKILWKSLGEPLHRYYKLTANYYKGLLREKKPGGSIYIESNGKKMEQVINFVYNKKIATRFTTFIQSWYNTISASKGSRCFACSYFTEGSQSWNVISKCFALGIIEMGNSSTTLCEQCSILRGEFNRLASHHVSVYNSVDKLINSTPHKEFVIRFLNDLAIDIVGEGAVANTGQIMVLLSCCFRAGMLWKTQDIENSIIEEQILLSDQLLKYAYQWNELFTALEKQNISVFQNLLAEFKLFLNMTCTKIDKTPKNKIGVRKITQDRQNKVKID